MRKHSFLRYGWITLLVAAAACQSGQAPSPSDDPSDPALPEAVPIAVGPERPLDQLAQHAALAFRAEPGTGALVGGYQTHRAAIRDGLVELTPYTFDGGERRARAPITLETVLVTMDDAQLAGPLTASRLEDGTAILERDGVVEQLRNDLDGVRQEWHFATRPELPGDLVVEVAVFGHQFTTSNDNGLHFRGPDGIGFRYSHAVWVSGDGKEYPIQAIHDSGRIRMTIPGDVVAATTFPAVLDPTITAETAVDSPVPGYSGANAINPAIAFDGNNYLVVWEDSRNSNDSDIWGTRLNAVGTIIDQLGFPIAAGPGRQGNPTVAYSGSRYVVAWEDYKVTGGTEADIGVATVSIAGAVTALPPIAATAAHEAQPALAGGGGTALLAWNAAGDIQGALFTTAFGAPFEITAHGDVEAEPAIAKSPTGNYLVAWSSGAPATADLRGQLVTPAGALSGASIDISLGAGGQLSPAVAFDGTHFAVVWTNNSGGLNIFGTRVSQAGVVLDTRTEGAATVGGISISSAINNQEVPSIACPSTGCVVVWQDRRNFATTGFDVYAQVMTPAFALSGAELIISNAERNQFSPVVISRGAALFTVWNDTRDGETTTVFGGVLSNTGAPGAHNPLVRGNNRETAPTIGLASNIFGVFWSDSRTFGNDIQYVRFTVNNSKIDTTSRVAAAATGAQVTPAATADLGTSSLVVWSDSRNGAASGKDIFAARVDLAGGNVLDPAGIPITAATGDQLLPNAASNGSVALVVWQDRRNASTFDIYGALVDATGAVTVPDIVISNAAADQGRPVVTWDPSAAQFLVAWSDNRDGMSHIYGTRVSATGEVLDPAGVQLSMGAVGQFGASIASVSSGSYVVWEDRKLNNKDIFGSRLTGGSSLTVLDPEGVAISTAAGDQTAPRIGSLGTSYVVVWVDARATQTDIYGQQIDASGAFVQTEFVVSGTPDNETNPAILKGVGNNVARIAYETRRLNTSRIATRVVTSQSPSGGTCSSASQCQSGFCTDGRCCNTACGGNDNTDCQACSFARTGAPDGICSPLPSTTTCRGYASAFCDLREYCDGVSSACPPDTGRNEDLVCNKSTNYPPGTGTGVCPSNAAPGPHACE